MLEKSVQKVLDAIEKIKQSGQMKQGGTVRQLSRCVDGCGNGCLIIDGKTCELGPMKKFQSNIEKAITLIHEIGKQKEREKLSQYRQRPLCDRQRPLCEIVDELEG